MHLIITVFICVIFESSSENPGCHMDCQTPCKTRESTRGWHSGIGNQKPLLWMEEVLEYQYQGQTDGLDGCQNLQCSTGINAIPLYLTPFSICFWQGSETSFRTFWYELCMLPSWHSAGSFPPFQSTFFQFKKKI